MDSYPILKTVHLLGAVMFVGNIVVTGWWKAMADRTRDARIVAFAQRQVTLTDWVFTLGGVVLVAVGGLGNATLHGLPMRAYWLQWVLPCLRPPASFGLPFLFPCRRSRRRWPEALREPMRFLRNIGN